MKLGKLLKGNELKKGFVKIRTIFVKFLVGFLILIWLFTGWPALWKNPRIPPEIRNVSALNVNNGDGIILYGVSGNTTPQWRTYNGTSNSFESAQGTVSGSTGLNFVVRTSPIKQEAIAGYVDSSGTLRIMCYDGTSWSNEWSATVGGTGTTRRFDIAYETNSGDVMVVYSTNQANTNELAYRTKPGSTGCGSSNWSSVNYIDAQRTSGVVLWIEMDSQYSSSSNRIALAWVDSNGLLSAMGWDGSSWSIPEPSSTFNTTPLEYISSIGNSKSFGVAVESNTGNIMVVWSVNGTTCTANSNTESARCATYSRYTTSWSTPTYVPTVADRFTNLAIAANRLSNEIVIAGIADDSQDLSLAYWSGSAWTGAANQDTSCATPAAGTMLVAAGWLTAGSTTRSIITYNDSGATNVGWYVGSGGTFTKQTDWNPTPSFGNPQKWYDIQVDPINNDRLMFIISDVNNDLFAKRLLMTSAPAFTWSNADGGAALEANLPQAIVSPFSFAYWRFIPPPTFNQSAYRFFNNLDSTDVGTPLANQDTPATLTSSGQAFRLRLLIHVGNGNLALYGQYFKLQFGTSTGSSCSTGPPSSWIDVTTTTVIAFNDNPTPTDGSALTANANDPIHNTDTIRNQTYEEANPFTNSVSAINSGEDGKWDFSLKDNGAPANTTYCLRVVKDDGSSLDTYSVIPQITTSAAAPSVSCTLSSTSTSFGDLSPSVVSTSYPNITITVTCSNTPSGCTVSVKDTGNGTNGGLYKSTSPTYLIPSPASGFPNTATLSAGTEGYGIQAATTTVGSGGTLSLNPIYKQTGNTVGKLTTTTQTLASSTSDVSNREVIVTHKASISNLTPAGDYQDSIIYSCNAN